MRTKICLILLLISLRLYAPEDIYIRQESIFVDHKITQKQKEIHEKVLRIVSVIRSIESGGDYYAIGESGEFGGYQFLESTWRLYSYAYFGEVLEMTPENQDMVAYLKVKSLIDKGYSPEEIASIWNSGSPRWEGKRGRNRWGVRYDVPKYVSKFKNKYYGQEI